MRFTRGLGFCTVSGVSRLARLISVTSCSVTWRSRKSLLCHDWVLLLWYRHRLVFFCCSYHFKLNTGLCVAVVNRDSSYTFNVSNCLFNENDLLRKEQSPSWFHMIWALRFAHSSLLVPFICTDATSSSSNDLSGQVYTQYLSGSTAFLLCYCLMIFT